MYIHEQLDKYVCMHVSMAYVIDDNEICMGILFVVLPSYHSLFKTGKADMALIEKGGCGHKCIHPMK